MIVELADDGTPLAIAVNPARPASNLAVMGVAFFDARVVELASTAASARGEPPGLAEIYQAYLEAGRLRVTPFGRGFAWLDTTTHAALAAAANFIETIESTQGLKIGCLEEIGYRKGFLSTAELAAAADEMPNAYGDYLRRLSAGSHPGPA